MKTVQCSKNGRRGDAFVDEPTGSATRVNLDGQAEQPNEAFRSGNSKVKGRNAK